MIDRIESIGKRYVHYLTMLHEVSIKGIRSPMSSDLMKKFKHISGSITTMQKRIIQFSDCFIDEFPRLDEPLKPAVNEDESKTEGETPDVSTTG